MYTRKILKNLYIIFCIYFLRLMLNANDMYRQFQQKVTIYCYIFLPYQRILCYFSRHQESISSQTFKNDDVRCDYTFFTLNMFSITIWGQTLQTNERRCFMMSQITKVYDYQKFSASNALIIIFRYTPIHTLHIYKHTHTHTHTFINVIQH